MAEVYYSLVINKRRTCNPENLEVAQVDKKYRERVLALLTERGYDADGNKVE